MQNHVFLPKKKKTRDAWFKREKKKIVFVPSCEWIRDPVEARAIRTKMFRQSRASNELSRKVPDIEDIWTLVKDGLKPIRHQMMNREKANKLNYANNIYKTGLQWVQGKQKL